MIKTLQFVTKVRVLYTTFFQSPFCQFGDRGKIDNVFYYITSILFFLICVISDRSTRYSKKRANTSINIAREVPMPKLKKMMKLNNLKVPWAHPDGRKRKKCRTKNTKEEK